MGTTDNIYIVHGLITHSQGKQLYCAFIYFTKAFDYIFRDNLCQYNYTIRLKENILNTIRSMFDYVKPCVKCNDKSGDKER